MGISIPGGLLLEELSSGASLSQMSMNLDVAPDDAIGNSSVKREEVELEIATRLG